VRECVKTISTMYYVCVREIQSVRSKESERERVRQDRPSNILTVCLCVCEERHVRENEH